jgi:hypothetical protein
MLFGRDLDGVSKPLPNITVALRYLSDMYDNTENRDVLLGHNYLWLKVCVSSY